MNTQSLVRHGYNLASHAYRDDKSVGYYKNHFNYNEWVKELQRRLPRHAEFLELGCGNGLPAGKALARYFNYLGLDLSETQIRRAKKLVPHGKFMAADMCGVKLKPAAYDAVVSLYSLIHVPRRQQLGVIKKVMHSLKPKGLFLLVVGMNAGQGTEKNWLGVKGATMFWALEDLSTYEAWFKKLGFVITRRRRIREGKVAHQLYLLSKS